jgi:hypothetical protein
LLEVREAVLVEITLLAQVRVALEQQDKVMQVVPLVHEQVKPMRQALVEVARGLRH